MREGKEERRGEVRAFGIRHLSPAGAHFVREFLEQQKPELVLIEGPADFNELLSDLSDPGLEPPFAVMAYSDSTPVRTLLYPFARYSPEYQTLLWCKEHGVRSSFFDLPSEIMLGLMQKKEEEENVLLREGQDSSSLSRDFSPNQGPAPKRSFSERLDRATEEGDSELFWERVLEQSADLSAYLSGSRLFGESLRELSEDGQRERAENLIREAYMRRVIREEISSGIPAERIAVITGAFHTDAVCVGSASSEEERASSCPPLSDQELQRLPRLPAKRTLMPYSYYRLTSRSGYGAGNRAPAYYELLFEGLRRGDPSYAGISYLSRLSEKLREHGGIVSSAELIEAMLLAESLAALRGGRIPTHGDLRDAAVSCMGHGSFGELAMGFAAADIGTKIGSVPGGLSRTSIQEDFYSELRRLRLEQYREMTARPLRLDLRENLRVKSEESAFLDLNRSFFLHRLLLLGIDFARPAGGEQENATWAENWVLQWTPEAEIQIVEAVLKGDSVAKAAAFAFQEKLQDANSASEIASLIETAFYCGMPELLQNALSLLDERTVSAVSMREIADTSRSLSGLLRYGDIRKLDRRPLLPILSRLTVRASLTLFEESACDEAASLLLAEDLLKLHEVFSEQEELNFSLWKKALREVALSDDRNTRISGLSAALLLDLSELSPEELSRELARRLSPGMPAELGAGWFEGLSLKNHYAIIARLSLWEGLGSYLDSLSEEEFRRALVFLRRAFSNYSAEEKDRIAENLSEIWGVNPRELSEILNDRLNEEETESVKELSEFDFGDLL